MNGARYPAGVIGAGAWGTALAQVMARAHGECLIWARSAAVASAINEGHENPHYLPGARLSPAIRATGSMAEMADCGLLLIAVPAQFMRGVLSGLPPTSAALILCTKGLEAGTQATMAQIAAELRPGNPAAILSGPSFAHEVAAGKPAAITLACADETWGARLALAIATPQFRPYWTSDVIGTEIGGAVKNVLAIGCGVVAGAGLGQNAGAALIARGFAEMLRFGMAKGARRETLAGLSGLGDLVLTCSSDASRNFALGRALGEGQSPKSLLAGRRSVAEGASTAPVLLASAQQMGVDMPITAAVCGLLTEAMNVQDAAEALLSRPLRAE